MKFHSKEHALLHQKAMQEDYKAVAFDVDGTLTEFAKFSIPDYLLETLEKIPLDIPLVLCTGRPIDFIKNMMDTICNATRNPEEQRRRWWIIAENGGSGHYYDPQTEGYVRFFEVPWPSREIEMEVLAAHLKDELGWHIHVLVREHTLVAVYPAWIYLFPRLLRMESGRNSKKIQKLLKERGLSEILTAQNSGLGTLLVPKDSGKGLAIQRLARKLDVPMKQILCVGDSPQEGGNDEDFLSGRFGTAFSVGTLLHQNWPLPVLDERQVHLKGPKGTAQLLRKLFQI